MPKTDDCDLQSLIQNYCLLAENNCVLVDGDAIRRVCKSKGITQTRLVSETKIGKGTIPNFLRGRDDPKTNVRMPWLGSSEYVAIVSKYLEVNILSLIITEPVLSTSSIAGTEFFTNSIASEAEAKLGLLQGMLAIEADLDTNFNEPETNREWLLQGVTGYVDQVGNFIGFTSMGEVNDNGLVFSKITFQGQLTGRGNYLACSFEFEGGDRWQYGMILAHRTSPYAFCGR